MDTTQQEPPASYSEIADTADEQQKQRRHQEIAGNLLRELAACTTQSELDDTCRAMELYLHDVGAIGPMLAEPWDTVLQQGLCSPFARLRVLAVRYMHTYCAARADARLALLQKPELCCPLVQLLREDLKQSSEATKLLILLGAAVLDVQPVAELLRTMSSFSDNEQLALRVYDVLCGIAASESRERCDAMLQHGWLDGLLKSATAPDTLLQLSVLELVARVTHNAASLAYLEHKGFVAYVARFLRSTLSVAMRLDATLLFPYMFELAGNVLQNTPDLASQTSVSLLESVARGLQDDSDEVVDGSISCIGKLGSRADGYTVLLAGDGSSGAPFAPKPLLQAFADVLTRSSTPLKLAALRAITSLISVQPSDGITAQAQAQVYHLINAHVGLLQDEPAILTTALRLLEQPALEGEAHRLLVYQLLVALVASEWGCTELLRSSLFPYVLERANEPSKDGKQYKFAVVQTAVQRHRDLCFRVAGTSGLEALARYYHQGPFWVESEHQVAIADESAS